MAVFRLPLEGAVSFSEIWIDAAKDTLKMSLMPLDPLYDDEECCWHPLFANSVIARGFPFRERAGAEFGLEIDFTILTNIAAILYPLDCYNGLVMKGLSSVLIPKRGAGGSIHWHLVLGSPGEKLSLTDISKHHFRGFYETQDLGFLVQARAFLGLYEKAQVHLGTRGSGYQHLTWSRASCEKSRFQVPGQLSFSFNPSISGMGSFMVGTKFVKQRGLCLVEDQSYKLLETRMLHAKSQPILLYDAGDQRGWLVPESSALLHLSLALISREDDIADVLDSLPHALDSLEGEAALLAIRNNKNIIIRDTTQALYGKPQRFIDFVTQILVGFEKRKEETLTKDAISTISKHALLRQPILYGWEAEELITGSIFCARREMKLNSSTAGDWYLLLKQHPELLVLFTQGLGEAIRPCPASSYCQAWNPIPAERDYLVATVPCLQQLSKTYDSECGRSVQLASDLYWHRPLECTLFDACGSGGSATGCNRLQDVKSKRANPPGPLSAEGAVVFGRTLSGCHSVCRGREGPAERPEGSPRRAGRGGAAFSDPIPQGVRDPNEI